MQSTRHRSVLSRLVSISTYLHYLLLLIGFYLIHLAWHLEERIPEHRKSAEDYRAYISTVSSNLFVLQYECNYKHEESLALQDQLKRVRISLFCTAGVIASFFCWS